jgi:hypothetical protein
MIKLYLCNMSYRQALSYILLFVFTLVSVPSDLIHELHDHEDTDHVYCETLPGQHAVSTVHIHCDYLKLEVQPYNFAATFYYKFISAEFSEFKIKETGFFYFSLPGTNHLRGPPFIA